MSTIRPGIKRLIIEVPIELHRKIKIKADERNISLRLWLTRLIIRSLSSEDKYNKTDK